MCVQVRPFLGVDVTLTGVIVALIERVAQFLNWMIQVNPPGSGRITFNGTTYMNGTTGDYEGGTFTVSATPPSGYNFAGWTATGGVSVASNTGNPTMGTITGPGTLQANFTKTPSPPLLPSGILLAALTTTLGTALVMRRRRRLA